MHAQTVFAIALHDNITTRPKHVSYHQVVPCAHNTLNWDRMPCASGPTSRRRPARNDSEEQDPTTHQARLACITRAQCARAGHTHTKDNTNLEGHPDCKPTA
eukprot:6465281-Amphidinium_carterae.1